MSPPACKHGWVDAASLYALPPEDFIAARDEASDAARAAGDPAAAPALKALRRPSVAAWLVNRLTVGQPGLLDQLLGLGPALAEAQAGGDATALRTLGARRRVRLRRRAHGGRGGPGGRRAGHAALDALRRV